MQTEHKNKVKNSIKQSRRVVKVSKYNIHLLESCFSLSGSKTDFQREYGVARQTVTRILAKKQGQEDIIKKMLKYARSNQ